MDTSFFDPVNDDHYIRNEVERVLASLDDKKLVNFNVFDEPINDDQEISLNPIKNLSLDEELSKYLQPSQGNDDSLLQELERRVDQVMKGNKQDIGLDDDPKPKPSDSRRLHDQIDRLQRENVRQQSTIKRLERQLGNQKPNLDTNLEERLHSMYTGIKAQREQAKQLHDTLSQLVEMVNTKSK